MVAPASYAEDRTPQIVGYYTLCRRKPSEKPLFAPFQDFPLVTGLWWSRP